MAIKRRFGVGFVISFKLVDMDMYYILVMRSLVNSLILYEPIEGDVKQMQNKNNPPPPKKNPNKQTSKPHCGKI